MTSCYPNFKIYKPLKIRNYYFNQDILWTPPSNVYKMIINLVGGGGGGGSGTDNAVSNTRGGGGGGGGSGYQQTITTTSIGSVNIIIGVGGSGGPFLLGSGNIGQNGNPTNVTINTSPVQNYSANGGQGGGIDVHDDPAPDLCRAGKGGDGYYGGGGGGSLDDSDTCTDSEGLGGIGIIMNGENGLAIPPYPYGGKGGGGGNGGISILVSANYIGGGGGGGGGNGGGNGGSATTVIIDRDGKDAINNGSGGGGGAGSFIDNGYNAGKGGNGGNGYVMIQTFSY